VVFFKKKKGLKKFYGPPFLMFGGIDTDYLHQHFYNLLLPHA